jgi:hypothetical protein
VKPGYDPHEIREGRLGCGAANIFGRSQTMLETSGQQTAMDSAAWDAHAELELAFFIRRHLAAYPPPAGSMIARDLERWSENLRCDGQARLVALGPARLTLAPA